MLPSLVAAARAIKIGSTVREAQSDMGPVITARARPRRQQRGGRREIVCDGRGVRIADAPNGFFVGATIIDQVQNEMTLGREEVFGPVLTVIRMDDLDHAIELANESAYGTGP